MTTGVRVISWPLQVLGTGSALPGESVSNERLLDAMSRLGGARVHRIAERVMPRVGVRGRHLARSLTESVETAREEHTNPRLAATAVRTALTSAQVDTTGLSYLIGHTASPHTLMPPNTAWTAQELAFPGPYMELRQACTGFANALQVAAGMLADPVSPPVAIVGSETGSLHCDLSPGSLDREQIVNCAQMGDGAGAIVLGGDAARGDGVIETMWFGSLAADRRPGFWMEPALDGTQRVIPFRHDYASVEKNGPALYHAGVDAARSAGYTMDGIDYLVPHQAGGHTARLVAQEFGIDPERVASDGETIGNLGSASIWVAFDRLRRSGRLAPGSRVLVLGAEATKFMYGGFVYRHGPG